MATKEQVEEFLKRLKEKIKVFDIIFRDDRGKNGGDVGFRQRRERT